METIKEKAIKASIEASTHAICRKTHVGAALYGSKSIDIGYNIENRCQKGYHAEEMAVLNAQLHNVDPKDIIGLVVTFSSDDIDRLTFCCGHCRQIVWEYTLNPKLLVTEVKPNGEIVEEITMEILYPWPYPRAEKACVVGRPDDLK